MKLTLYAGLLVTCLCIGGHVFGQSTFNLQQPPILPQAPNTATLGKFGDYQVSLFTGVPQISIPLYTIKTPSFEVPITLMYHASGIMLYDFPGWVGSGWALSAGGEIRRKMVGFPDELNWGFMDNMIPRASSINQNSGTMYDTLVHLTEGHYDSGADIFSYSFPGGDGKFFFDRDSGFKPVLMPYAPVKIVAGPRDTFHFDITDGYGNLYQFGKTYADFTESGASVGSHSQVSAWMLEKMFSATKGDSISFTYQRQADRTPLERSDTWSVSDVASGGAHHTYSPSEGTFSASYSQSDLYYCSQQEIRFKNGRIVFELDSSLRQDFAQTSNSRRLKKIKIYSTTPDGERLFKVITFFHSYFTDGTDESKRLRLDSVQVSDSTSISINSYQFDYNTEVNLPAVGTTTVCKDFWGYYNGKNYNITTNNTLVPQTWIYYQATPGATTDTIMIGSPTTGSREPDSVYMQAAILKKIHFPTGGYTEFSFETNKYLDDSNHIKLAGGLRVKSIKSYDGISAIPLVKTYKYGENESGVGRANFYAPDMFFYDEQEYRYWYSFVDPDTHELCESCFPGHEGSMRVRTYYSNPSIDIQPADAAPVVYPWVTEYIGEDSNTLGKTVYEFRDSSDGVVERYNSSKGQVVSHFFDRGQPLRKKVYKKTATGVFQPVTEERYSYNNIMYPVRIKYGGLLLEQNVINETNNPTFHFSPSTFVLVDYWFWNDYYIQSDDNYPISSTSRTYDADDSSKYSETMTMMEYGNFLHQQPNTTTKIDSKGDTIILRIKYPAEYIATGVTTGNAVLDTMLQKNMQAYEIEKWQEIRKPSQSARVAGGQLNFYKQLSSGYVVPDKQCRLDIAAPVTGFQPSTISSGVLQGDTRYDTVIKFNRYDADGNILSLQKKDDILVSYIWDYLQAMPVAEVKNADATYIAYSSFEADGKGNWSYLQDSVSAGGDCPTGTRQFHLVSGNTISRSSLDTARSYVVSYWSKNGSYTVTGSTVTRQGRTADGWTLYEHEVSGTGSVTISGTGYIDEVRLFPKTALMTSYTYAPLIGQTSQCDANNHITYYEYDAFGRLKLIKDQDKNIIKTFDYQYKQPH